MTGLACMDTAPDSRLPYAQLHAALAAQRPGAIAIYGLGVVAKTVIGMLDGYKVVGLMDKDPANRGKIFYGLTVLGDNDLPRRGVDVIVIAASDVYWRTIAERIAPLCRTHGIRILFPNGETAPGQQCESTAISVEDVDLAHLENEVAHHDVISFDLFETLVTRLASRPDDLLEAAIARTRSETGFGGNLLSARQNAEAACRDIHGAYRFPLADVYRRMDADGSVPEAVSSVLHKWELAIEESFAVPRAAMVDLLRRCQGDGKQVVVTTDTHLPRERLVSILKRCGIADAPPLLVSWQEGAAKADGRLFDVLRERYPAAAILHIGDNVRSDVDEAKRHGLSTYRIPSPAERMLSSRLGPLHVHARTAHDGVLLGLVARHLFADPFIRLMPDGRIEVDNLRRFGYLFFGPLLLAWLGWLARALQRRPMDKLLFLAREGHLLSRIYNRLRTEAGWHGLPEGVYFATSRRMASVAALRTPADVRHLLQDDFSGSSEQLLRLRFGLEANGGDKEDLLVHSDAGAAALIERHMDAILANARDERDAYLQYMARLGIATDSRVAVADLGIKGTIQNGLQRVLNKDLQGYYITGYFGEANPYGMHDNTAAYLCEAVGKNPGQVYRYHILCESVLVAPEGMYLRAGADGGFVNAPVRMNQSLFARKEEIHRGIEEFIANWLATGIDPMAAAFSPALVDALFGQAMGDAVAIGSDVKEVFYVDECYRAETEKRIWD